MSDYPYTTGELAEACGVTVRTVQHYDNKGLLAPSGYSEGGRRLYSEADADRLRFILLLKSMGLGLAQVRGVLDSPHSDDILKALLDEQAAVLRDELDERARRLAAINTLRSDLELFGKVMTTTETDMVDRMNDERARHTFHIIMVLVGITMDVAWIGTLILGIVTGIWWPFPIALAYVLAMGIWMVTRYDAHATYLCPVCHAEFRSKIGPFLVSRHTLHTRRLTCPCCGEKDWCVERYHAEPLAIAPGTCVPDTCDCA